MAEKNARRESSQAEAVAQIREGETFAINLPVIGQVEIPRPEQLSYYGGLAALAALELIDWPVAVVIMAGHLLASNHHNRLLEELGEAIEDAEKRSARVVLQHLARGLDVVVDRHTHQLGHPVHEAIRRQNDEDRIVRE